MGVQVPPPAPQIYFLIMLKIVKYIKRSRTFADFKHLINQCILSKPKTESQSIKITKIISYLWLPITFSWNSIRRIFFVTKTSFSNNTFVEYSLYKEYTKYKFFALIFILFLSFLLIVLQNKKGFFINNNDYIAKITIDTIITDDEYGYGGSKFYEKVIQQAIEKKNIKGVIIYINSPGGYATASEILYKNLLKLAYAKPTFCDIGSVGASGSYMAALACKKIYAKEMSNVGSIGVRFSVYEISDLAKKIGINFTVVHAGDLKAAGDPWKKLDKKEVEYFQKTAKEAHSYFIDLVANERNLSVESVTKVANGSVMHGQQAKKLGLIDEIGDQYDILEEMIKTYNLPKDIKIQDIKMEKESENAFNLRKLIGLITISLIDNIKNATLFTTPQTLI